MAIGLARVRALVKDFLQYFYELNIYVAAHEDTPEVRHDQILSTRLYACLLTISMLIVLQYTALSSQTIITKVEKLTLSKFEKLEALYPNSLSCPCSQIATSPDTFITMEIKFHQVC